MGIVLSVNMNKGGVGKTSLITNLAGAIHLRMPLAKILIIDTDAQGNAALSFGLVPHKFENNMNDVMLGNIKIEDIITQVEKNIFLAPANDDLNTLEFNVLIDKEKYPKPFMLLKPHIDRIRDKYDFILIDTPPSLGMVAGNVLATSDYTIIPFVPEWYSVQGLIRIIDAFNMFREKVNHNLRLLGVVGMMVESRTTLHTQMMQDARKYCHRKGIKLFETMIPKTIRYANAVAYHGKPAILIEHSSPLVTAYFELMEEIFNELQK